MGKSICIVCPYLRYLHLISNAFTFIHSVFSPVEEERIQVMKEMEELLRQPHVQATADNDVLMDECELLDQYEERLSVNSNTGNNVKTKKKSSHELVEMAHDGDTPKRIRDGEFGKQIYVTHLSTKLFSIYEYVVILFASFY